jgi:hypothetical protein
MAFERTRPFPRRAADINLTAIVAAVHASTVEDAVDSHLQRYLRVPLAAKDRTVLVDFLRGAVGASALPRGATLEPALRELLYLVLSTPEYQLG